ncbi:MAG: type I methionyl aminopeptidase [Candidatus Omnitrophica bacterium]|nr:type I methionyl aminopeptidase [Candidatus Omnitrophota bacterium]
MIALKSDREIGIMREAGEIIKEVLAEMEKSLRSGMTTDDLDRMSEEMILKAGGEPAFKGYHGFPKTACISLNEEVVHGIPGEREIKDQDIVSFDVGVRLQGYHADAARTWVVGNADQKIKSFVDSARGALAKALKNYQPGWRIGDLSAAIQSYVEAQGYQVVRNYVGHGIGREMHEDPQVPNFGKPGQGPKIEPGLVVAIEPMVTEGHYDVEVLENGWTVVTKDKKYATHYEDTIAFLENGFMNLTGDLGKEF